jgi:hypothetical protein
MLKTVSPFNTTAPTFSGNVTLSNGNLVIGTAGKGIDFSASPNPGGMTSELLDDYEEGTFTPTLAGSSTNFSSVTYAVQSGFYVKVGDLVHVDIYLQTSSVSGGSGDLLIAGLPFAALASSAYNNTGDSIGFNIGFAGTYVESYVPQGTSTVAFLTAGSGAPWAGLSTANWGTSTALMKVSITYRAN